MENSALVGAIPELGFEGRHVKAVEKFYRANVQAVETKEPIGIIPVRLIIERFGGKVWCESTEGAGSKFLFTIPPAV
jgi:signal transduction histidine kinase